VKVLSTLWGLLVDDRRLASILILAIVISTIVSNTFGQPLLGALILWAGLIVSLFVSIEHQLRLKSKK
jgi:hypothetical protein